jgi:hypothetical protein
MDVSLRDLEVEGNLEKQAFTSGITFTVRNGSKKDRNVGIGRQIWLI